MKKLLLTLAAAGAIVTASATVADLSQVWNAPVENAYKAEAKEWNAPVAVDAEGNVIATGAFTEDFTIAGANLEAIGTSAYVVKYDKTGNAAWAVAFTGAATITAIDTDADGNIYIAGTLADEVTFGTTSGTPIIKEGMKVNGDPTIEQNASFLAKYDQAGVLNQIETLVPQIQPALLPLIGDYDAEPMYMYGDGDVRFYISEIKVIGDKIYVGATFTGITEVGGKTFDSGYVNYYGFMYQDNLKASLFSLSANTFESANEVVLVGDATENGGFVMNTNGVSSIKFAINSNNIFVSAIGIGDLKYNDKEIPAQTIEGEYGEDQSYVFINTLLNESGAIVAQSTTVANANRQGNGISNIFINSENAIIVGKSEKTDIQIVGEGDDTEKVAKSIKSLFVNTIAFANELTNNIQTIEVNPVDSYNYGISASALLPGGEIYINTLDKDIAKSFVFANDAFAPATTVTDAVGVAAAGSYVAFSQIGETGAIFSLYNDTKSSGISDIVADENAEAEYFNLQGVRVANPENGLYIVRRGNKVTKEVIR